MAEAFLDEVSMARLRTPGCLAIYGVQGQGPAHSVFQWKQFPYAVPGQMTFIPTAVEGSPVAAAQTATSELVERGLLRHLALSRATSG